MAPMIHKQLQHAIKQIERATTSKWHIHEKYFVKIPAQFTQTETLTTRDILNILLKSIHKGFITTKGNKKDNMINIDHKISKDNLQIFDIDNSLSLHMTKI